MESQGLLKAHMQNHEFECKSCDFSFENKIELEKHITDGHTIIQHADEWNCDTCAYQASTPAYLMNHLKETSHKPSPTIKDRRAVFQDYRKCYTCKLEFDGYWNLMNHRSNVHPSNKKSRIYPASCYM